MDVVFETYRRADGRWGWRLTHRNGNVVAVDGSQGYERRIDAENIGWNVVSGCYDVMMGGGDGVDSEGEEDSAADEEALRPEGG